jgi:hypothetical protein
MADNAAALRAEVQRLRSLAVYTTDRKALVAIQGLIEELERRAHELDNGGAIEP